MKKISIVLLSVLLVASLTACSTPSDQSSSNSTQSSSETQKSSSISSVKDESSSSSSAKSESDEEKVDDDTISFKIGDTTEVGTWEVNVTKFKFQDEIQADYGSFVPEEGNKYLIVSAVITNTGETSDDFLPMFNVGNKISCNVVHDGKYEYSSSSLLGHDKDLNNSTLNPLIEKKGIIAFEIPNKIANSDKPLVFNLNLDDKTYSCSLEKTKK